MELPRPELLDWSILFFSGKTGFSRGEHLFIDKADGHNRATLPSALLLGLG